MKRLLQTLAGLAVSGVALALTLRGKDLGLMAAQVREADYRWLWPFLAILLAVHLVRTVRWGLLLEPVAKVRFARLNAVSAVGIMGLVLLPFRLGEFARPYLIAERPRLRVSAALSSVVVERVADGLFTAVLLMLTLLAVPEGTRGLHAFRVAGAVVFLVFGLLLAFIVLAYLNRPRAVRLSHRLLDPFSPRLAGRVSGMMDAFIHGLRLVPSRRKIALFFVLTGAYWAMNGLGVQLFARAFDIRLGLVGAFTVLGAMVVGVMIPAGPGSVGTYQAAVLAGLSLFMPVGERELAFANVMWLVQFGQQVLVGLVFLPSRHIHLGHLRALEEGPEEEEPTRG